MSYQKQNFRTGDTLYASQLDAMEEGIIDVERLAMEGIAGAPNMEKGTGEGSSQQVGDPSRVVDGQWDFNDSEGNPRNPNAADLRDENGNYPFVGMQDYGATGKYSGTFGGSNRASGSRSFAVNNRTIAAGDESFAQGYCTVAFGPSSFAGGSKTLTFEEAAVALGDSTIAGGKCSMAIGSNTIAHAQNAIAIGDRTEALGINSYAGGCQSTAVADGAFVHGYNVNTHEEYGIAFGRNNIATEGAIFTIGNGINETSNAFVAWADGRASVYGAPKNDEDVIRQIDLSTAVKNMEQFIGVTYSDAPIHIGDGSYSVQQFDNFATNSHASAFGNATTASGENSFAQGSGTEASGYCSFVGGQQSKATGNTSTAIGLGVKTTHDRQVAIGQFNIDKEGTVFEVGGGHADDNRINAFEVYLDGDVGIRFNGKTYSLHKMLASYFTDANLK